MSWFTKSGRQSRMRFLVVTLSSTLLAAAAFTLNATGRDSSDSPAHRQPEILNRAARTSPRVQVIIEMDEASAAQVFAETTRSVSSSRASASAAHFAARQQIDRIDGEQRDFLALARANSIDTDVLYSLKRVFNGIAANVSRDDIARIRQMPGVKSVRPLAKYRLALAVSVPTIRAPQAWVANGGNRGDGIRIGIIDTGIDYIHRDFGGSGNYAGQNYTDAIVPWNNKVVGGWDFAGDNYDPDSTDPSQAVPHPDADPMDCHGHGSHVSGIAAGYGVLKDGSTFTGPWDSSTNFSTFSIGPGVAPGAKLYALRIFGCSGSTVLAPQAMEWAVDPNADGDFSDHLDVINMSLGSPYGSGVDIAAIAANNAALAGVTVVAAAGNEADVTSITGAPAVADRAISVASSTTGAEYLDTLKIEAPAAIAGNYASGYSQNYDYSRLTTPLTADVAYPASQRDGCSSYSSSNASTIRNKIALIDWTDNGCSSTTRVQNASTAGAVGAVIMYPRTPLDTAIYGSSQIPAAIVDSTLGSSMRSNLAGLRVTFSLASVGAIVQVNASQADLVSDFSSLGPRLDDSMLKPDVTAPGDGIISVKARSGSKPATMSGTSMATPHIAGAMALLKQAHPGYTTEELKALLMNTASHDLVTDHASSTRYGVVRVGAGRVDLENALNAQLLAYADDHSGRVSLSFGAVEVNGTASLDRTFAVVNKSSQPVTATLGFDFVTAQPGVSFSLPDGNSVTLAAGESKSLHVRFSANAAAMRNTRDQSLRGTVTSGLPRHYLTEAGGYITVTPATGTAIRLPVYAIARPVSSMRSATNSFQLTGDHSHVDLHLAGTSLNTGSSANDIVSLVAPFELQIVDTNESSSSGLFNGGDIQYVGVTTDYPAKKAAGAGVADSLVQFGISTWGNWTTLNVDEFDILIDTNNDGTDDFVVLNFPSDVFQSIVCPTSATSVNQCLPARGLLNGSDAAHSSIPVFNSNVLTLTVPASQLGLTDAASTFTYHVESSAYDFNGVEPSIDVDETAKATYDVKNPGVVFTTTQSGATVFTDNASTTIPADITSAAFRSGSRGILLLHYANGTGSRAEFIPAVTGTRLRPVRR